MYLGCQDHNIILAGGLTFFMTDYMVTYTSIKRRNTRGEEWLPLFVRIP
jgi:hypothetical protein